MSIGRAAIRRNRNVPLFGFLSLVFLFAITWFGCGSDGGSDPASPSSDRSDCVGCHTDKAMILATAEEDTTTSGGDAGET